MEGFRSQIEDNMSIIYSSLQTKTIVSYDLHYYRYHAYVYQAVTGEEGVPLIKGPGQDSSVSALEALLEVTARLVAVKHGRMLALFELEARKLEEGGFVCTAIMHGVQGRS
jgi:hypothetical protein